MGNHDDHKGRADWENLLKQGIDQLSDLKDEEPPNLAALQMLVAQTQIEQRRQFYGDLLAFLAMAAMLLTSLAFALLREPVYFLVFQGAGAVLSVLGAGAWYTGQRRAAK